MPRRKVADKNPPEAPKTKKKKKASDLEPRFEWENDGGKWTVYADKFHEHFMWGVHNEDMSKPINFTVNKKIRMSIDCGRSVQKNLATGWQRRVRIAHPDPDDGSYYVFEWQDENKRWNPYGIENSIELNEALTLTDTKVIRIDVGANSYLVDLSGEDFVQRNKATGVERPVRKLTSSAELPEAGAGDNIRFEKEEDEEQEEIKPKSKATKTAKGKSERAKSAGKSKAAAAGDGEPQEKVRKIVKKGAAPVDAECPKVESAHVYVEGKTIYDAMLNQTNLQNNNNKYYLMQILEDDNAKSYCVWFRWGRVGKSGQNSLIPCGPDLEDAKRTFTAKFYDKTKNQWESRKSFKKVAGKYDMVELDYSAGADEVDAATPQDDEKVDVPDSKLDKKLQDLINLICDVKSMEEAVVEMKYDAKKAPLGKLTSAQIKAGNAALKKIETLINKGDLGQHLIQACDEFYTRIPHDFGMRQPPVIRTSKEVKQKMQLLETLADIEVAMNILKRQKSTENPVDTHYSDLKCDLVPMGHTDPTYKVIESYLQNTHANTHNQYKMQLLDVFEMDKHGEGENFNDVGNKVLLWHGSRLTNWVGILSQGLRIAPPEAPVTGYMFGKGVYFADMSSKSANYCYATRSKDVGLMLLCEVALGKPNELLAADMNASNLPKGTHSVMGKGQMAPDPATSHKLPDGTIVPLGKQKATGVTNPHGYTLNYNEFIVYDLNQIKMKYLLKIKFNFKGF